MEKDIEEIRNILDLPKDGRDWKIETAKKDLIKGYEIEDIQFRPFDYRKIPYTGNSKGIISYPRHEINKHMIEENVGLIAPRFFKEDPSYFLSNKIIGHKVLSAYDKNTIFPLYLYPQSQKISSLSAKAVRKKQALTSQLKLAKANHKQSESFFNNTILPFFEKIETLTPNEIISLEEHRSTYEESVASLENIQEQLQILENPQIEIIPTETKRKPNLNQKIVNEIATKIGMEFTNEEKETKNTFAPIDILDYIYAVLHSPNYREKYKEFLKIDFPKIPYPKDTTTFWELVELGKQIREIHLLESDKIQNYITTYSGDGNDIITTKIAKKDWKIIDKKQDKTKQLGRIYINETQYFDKIPLAVWEFYIGGYQPAQKWLKDRKNRKLSYEDILHYQKIIVALSETNRLMKQIDEVEIE